MNWGGIIRWVLVCFLSVSIVKAAAPTEQQIKSAFLYNFVQYVNWPDQVFESSKTPFIIGVIEPDVLGSDLDETLAGKQIQNRRLITKRFSEKISQKSCHVLFFGTSNIRPILKQLRNAPVLTVGDGEDFAKLGGMIGFYIKDRRIKLIINLGSAVNAGLKISSQLLRVATVIQ